MIVHLLLVIYLRVRRDYLKKIKYLIFFVLVIISTIIIGDSFQDYVNTFENQLTYVTMNPSDPIDDEEVLNDLITSANRNNVGLILTEGKNESNFSNKTDIYFTNGLKNYINQDLLIEEKEYESIFFGSHIVNFHDFSDIYKISEKDTFYLVGSDEDNYNFKMELIEKYGGSHPRKGSENLSVKTSIIFLWIIISLITLFMTYYDMLMQKKENFIKISLGEKTSTIILKNILFDTGVFIFIFGISNYFLSFYTNSFFQISVSILALLILIILNSLIYFNLYRLNYKEMMHRKNGSIKLLSVNYGIKILTTALTMIILSANIVVIFEAYSFYTQKDFFENYSDYNYVTFFTRPKQNQTNINELQLDSDKRDLRDSKLSIKLYKENFNKANATTQLSFGITDHLEKNKIWNMIYMNKNTKDYLVDNVKELDKDIFNEEKIYFILPKELYNDPDSQSYKDQILTWTNWSLDYNNNYNFQHEFLKYDSNINLISTTPITEVTATKSTYIQNPIIIYNNINEELHNFEVTKPNTWNTFNQDIMYRMTPEEILNFAKENDFDVNKDSLTIINVYDDYINQWNTLKKSMTLSIGLSLLFLLLEFIIIFIILKLEFSVNATELLIKKVLGHGMFSRNKSIFTITVITTILSVIVSSIVSLILGFLYITYIILIALVILTIESIFIYYFVKKLEKVNIQKILKGGNL